MYQGLKTESLCNREQWPALIDHKHLTKVPCLPNYHSISHDSKRTVNNGTIQHTVLFVDPQASSIGTVAKLSRVAACHTTSGELFRRTIASLYLHPFNGRSVSEEAHIPYSCIFQSSSKQEKVT